MADPRSGRRRAGSVFALQTPKGMLASLCVTRALAGVSGGGPCSECGLHGPSGRGQGSQTLPCVSPEGQRSMSQQSALMLASSQDLNMQ